MAKLFFTSYAHVNRNRHLERFLERLRAQIVQYDPTGQLKENDVYFFDSEGIQTGEEWIRKLGDAVKESKVCVAICTPAFVKSTFCGKELRIFLERLQQWRNLPQNAGVPARSIIPIIWVNTDLPPALKEFQYNEKEFPEDYRQEGMLTLCQISSYNNARKRVEITLAKRILAAAAVNLPPQAAIPHFDLISSIFHENNVGTRYGVALVALIKNEVFAKPFGQQSTLRNLMDEACGPRIPWRPIEQNKNLKQNLQDAKNNKEAILIVADLETLNDALYKNIVQIVDQETDERCGFLLIRNDGLITGIPTTDQQVEITLKGLFPNAFGKWSHKDWTSVRSVESLGNTLLESIARIRDSLIKADPGTEVRDDRLVASAAAEGISIGKQPILSGPGKQ